jgi:hypothetical protein
MIPPGTVLRKGAHHDAEQVNPGDDLLGIEVWAELEIEARMVDGELVPQYAHWLVSAATSPDVDPSAVRTGDGTSW